MFTRRRLCRPPPYWRQRVKIQLFRRGLVSCRVVFIYIVIYLYLFLYLYYSLLGRLTRGYQGVSLEIPGSVPPFVKNRFSYRKINFLL